MRFLAALLLFANLAATPACGAHHQLTNRQLLIGGGVAVGLGALLYLAIAQCRRGPGFCDDSPAQ